MLLKTVSLALSLSLFLDVKSRVVNYFSSFSIPVLSFCLNINTYNQHYYHLCVKFLDSKREIWSTRTSSIERDHLVLM